MQLGKNRKKGIIACNKNRYKAKPQICVFKNALKELAG